MLRPVLEAAWRDAAIAALGAETIRVPGPDDDSVAEAARRAAAGGWTGVSDTAWPGHERIPRLVMLEYTVMVREALEALPEAPTHVLVQAGVGGLAASVAGHLVAALGPRRPAVVVVEPAGPRASSRAREAGAACRSRLGSRP